MYDVMIFTYLILLSGTALLLNATIPFSLRQRPGPFTLKYFRTYPDSNKSLHTFQVTRNEIIIPEHRTEVKLHT